MDKDLERIILAQWLHGKCLDDIDTFSADDFDTYRELFKAIKTDGIAEPIALCRKANLPAHELSEKIVSAYSPFLYDNAVSTFFQDKGKAWLQQNIDKPLDKIIEGLSKYVQRNVSIPEPTPDPVENMLDELDRRAKETPVLFGLSGLDYFLGGVRPYELTFIAARPSVGKSAFCFQCARNVAAQGKKVLFLSLEMTEISMTERHLHSIVKLSNYQLRKGILKDAWQNMGAETTDEIAAMRYFYQSGNFILYGREGKNGSDPADLKVIRELIRIHRPYLVVIDQLEQIKESGMRFTDKRARFSHATHTLQEIALQEGVAIWCACQVNRDADNRPPSLANLKESGTIEEDANNVILLHRESENADDKQTILCNIGKQKNGKCGAVRLVYDAPRFTFYGEEHRAERW